MRALAQLNRAITLTDGFLGAPAAPAGALVRAAATAHFKSADHGRRPARPWTAQPDPDGHPRHGSVRHRVSRRVGSHPARTRDRVRRPCASPSGWCSAPASSRRASRRRPRTIVHEMAHAQVGGVHITDRSYSWERMRRFLSLEEALTNAESYDMYVSHLNHRAGAGDDRAARYPGGLPQRLVGPARSRARPRAARELGRRRRDRRISRSPGWRAGAPARRGACRRPDSGRHRSAQEGLHEDVREAAQTRSTSSARPAAAAAAAAPSSTGTPPATCTSARRGAPSEPRASACARC